jgi:hypothetical protein
LAVEKSEKRKLSDQQFQSIETREVVGKKAWLSEKEKDIQQSNKSEETIFHPFMSITKIQMAQEHKMLMENHRTLISDN